MRFDAANKHLFLVAAGQPRKKIVRAANQDEANSRSQDFTFSIKNEGGAYCIVFNRDENRFRDGRIEIRIGNDRQRYKSNLRISVPRKASVDLTNKYGAVALIGLEGTQSISNKYGPTSVHDVAGSITITTGYGSLVVDNVSGSAKTTNGYASTTLRNIGENADIDNKYGLVDV